MVATVTDNGSNFKAFKEFNITVALNSEDVENDFNYDLTFIPIDENQSTEELASGMIHPHYISNNSQCGMKLLLPEAHQDLPEEHYESRSSNCTGQDID
ncbi:UNVERIFIED_CONTAM: hypothetical protein FKN15_035426 [Acipenser sinensis]